MPYVRLDKTHGEATWQHFTQVELLRQPSFHFQFIHRPNLSRGTCLRKRFKKASYNQLVCVFFGVLLTVVVYLASKRQLCVASSLFCFFHYMKPRKCVQFSVWTAFSILASLRRRLKVCPNRTIEKSSLTLLHFFVLFLFIIKWDLIGFAQCMEAENYC